MGPETPDVPARMRSFAVTAPPCYNLPRCVCFRTTPACTGGFSLTVYLNVAQIIVSIALIALTVMQSKGAGLGRMFGGDSSIYRTRRGVEKTMHNLTVILAVVFFLTSLLSVILQS